LFYSINCNADDDDDDDDDDDAMAPWFDLRLAGGMDGFLSTSVLAALPSPAPSTREKATAWSSGMILVQGPTMQAHFSIEKGLIFVSTSQIWEHSKHPRESNRLTETPTTQNTGDR
jgi:hypothetical protein